MAANQAHVWKIPTEDGIVERQAETLSNPEVGNHTTGRPGRRLDLSLLLLREDKLITILDHRITYSTLTVLNLNNCGLGTLPRAISNVENLVRLRLHSNNLRTLPNTLGDLRYLQRLSVYGNRLESLPQSFSEMHSVKILRLGGNNLEHEELDVIQDMEGLEELYLRENDELMAIPKEVCLMQSLNVLNADDCSELVDPPLQVIQRGIREVKLFAEHNDW